jgi:hypothetical protein
MSAEPPLPESVTQVTQEWANELHRDMIAATLLDPNLICFRSVATDVPESVVRARLLDEMTRDFRPNQMKDLRSFLPNLVMNTVK